MPSGVRNFKYTFNFRRLQPSQYLPIVKEIRFNGKTLEQYQAEYKALLITLKERDLA